MDVRQIETYQAVMTYGTTSRASEALGISQPAVSKASWSRTTRRWLGTGRARCWTWIATPPTLLRPESGGAGLTLRFISTYQGGDGSPTDELQGINREHGADDPIGAKP